MEKNAAQRHSALGRDAPEVRHSPEGLQFESRSFVDGLEVIHDHPGMQALPAERLGLHSFPQTTLTGEKEAYIDHNPSSGLQTVDQDPKSSRRSSRLKWIALLAALGVMITIIVVVTITQTRRNQTTSGEPTVLPPSPPVLANNSMIKTSLATMNAYYSVVATSWLFYQQMNGDIGYYYRSFNGTWQGGASLGIADCSNQSSIAAIYYSGGIGNNLSHEIVYQLFYINTAGVLTSISKIANATAGSMIATDTPTSIGLLTGPESILPNITTLPTLQAPHSALFMFLDYGWFNTSNLRLYMANVNGSVQEYTWPLTKAPGGPWAPGFVFPNSNGYAGVSAVRNYSLVTLTLVNLDNQLEMWWKDYQVGQPNATHTVGSWTKVDYNYTDLYTHLGIFSTSYNSSVAVHNSAYFQGPDDAIYGAQLITDPAIVKAGIPPEMIQPFETLGKEYQVATVLPGTSLAAPPYDGVLAGSSDPELIYLQSTNGTILQYYREYLAPSWNVTAFPTFF